MAATEEERERLMGAWGAWLGREEQFYVASAKLVGDGAPKDVGGGLAQLDASCTARQAAACSMLSNLYTRGLGTDVVANADRAHAYAAKGCSLGDAPSCAAARR